MRNRKQISIVLCGILLICAIVICLCVYLTSCFKEEGEYILPETEWDGTFLYVYSEEKDGYYIVNSEPELRILTSSSSPTGKTSCPNKVYLPCQYKGKRILGHSFSYYTTTKPRWGTVEYRDFLELNSAEELYLPYEAGHYCGRNSATKFIVTSIDERYMLDLEMLGDEFRERKVYVPSIIIEDIYEEYLREMEDKTINWDIRKYVYLDLGKEGCGFKLVFEWKEGFEIKDGIHTTYFYPANTAFMFNYEEAPNEGYFFINDFERGELIENYCYEPTRDGYKFTGWYKDSECTQKWDFAVDTLPAPTYSENGEMEFIETRLYAKWDKI